MELGFRASHSIQVPVSAKNRGTKVFLEGGRDDEVQSLQRNDGLREIL